MTIPYTKAHGAKNDFLLTWAHEAPAGDVRAIARAICDRYTGVGSDGWILVGSPTGDALGSIRLYNSDGSDSEISGNGTRCAAAFLLSASSAPRADELRIATRAGVKHLRVLARRDRHFEFEMNMGAPVLAEGGLKFALALNGETREVTILDMGNPQCAVFVDDFDFDWRAMGKRIEWHPQFPNRTNVSFVRVADRHTVETRFWERGAEETQSSGTGSSGAAAAAILLGLAESPVVVRTPAGELLVRWESRDLYLTGPAEIVASGSFYFSE